MVNNRIRAIVGVGVLASALGLGALGTASVATADPGPDQLALTIANPVDGAPDRWYCQHYDQWGNPTWFHWGRCRPGEDF
jgi:hypothetical protein